MKLSFSIRHWENMSWRELCAAAAETRLQGVELCEAPVLRGKQSPASPELSARTRR